MPSLNNILQLAAPLAANELLQNKTYITNINRTVLLGMYTIILNSIHLNSVDGFDVKDLSFVDKTDTL